MSKPTGISLKDFCKALEISAVRSGYERVSHGYTEGSIYGFEFFQKRSDTKPLQVFVVHFGRGRKREIWSDDLKKVWERTAISKELFLEILKTI